MGQLVDHGADENESVLFVLAHEIFHADESERMNLLNLTFFEAQSKFCMAARPSFPKEHVDFLRLCAHATQGKLARKPTLGYEIIPLEIARSEDVATELCADLLALHWMRKNHIDTSKMEKSLLSLRAEVEANSVEGYQIGLEMPALLGLNTFDEIVAATSMRTISILAAAQTLPPEIKNSASDLLANYPSLNSAKKPVTLLDKIAVNARRAGLSLARAIKNLRS